MQVSARIDALASDREHGASFLARKAVEILVESSAAGEDPLEVARALAGARPAMGAIAGAVGRVVAAAHDPEQIVVEGRALLARSERAARSIAVLVAPYVVGGRVLTHSTSATVAEVIRHAGAVETREMIDANVVVVGADTVFRDGSVVNAAGTRALAEKAARAGVPVLVAAETIKLVPSEPVEPEEEGFDLTPAELIDRIATEEGIFPPTELLALVDRSPFLFEGYELVAHAHVS